MHSFSLLEKRILALHFSGSYITNFEFKTIGQKVGLEVDLADREKMLKTLFKQAKEKNKEPQLLEAIAEVLQERLQNYRELAQNHPKAKEVVEEYIQKCRSTIMLLGQKARISHYE